MFCPQCGKPAGVDQKFCGHCGGELDAAAAAERASVEVYASFGRRVLAYLIDHAIGIAALVLISVVATVQTSGWYLLLWVLGVWLYKSAMESSSYQATLGKLALGIKVTDRAGERLTFLHATGRFAAFLVSCFTGVIGFVLAAFTERRQALHDFLAATLVVRKGRSAAEVAAAPPARNSDAIVVIVIVLVMAFVAFAGILAAIAIPAYQDYAIRAQVSEGLRLAAPFETQVTQAVGVGTDIMGATTQSLGITLPDAGRYVESIRVDHGAVVIRFGNAASMRIQGAKLVLHPVKVSADSIAWACGYRDISGTQLDAPNIAATTDIAPKFLPQLCRR